MWSPDPLENLAMGAEAYIRADGSLVERTLQNNGRMHVTVAHDGVTTHDFETENMPTLARNTSAAKLIRVLAAEHKMDENAMREQMLLANGVGSVAELQGILSNGGQLLAAQGQGWVNGMQSRYYNNGISASEAMKLVMELGNSSIIGQWTGASDVNPSNVVTPSIIYDTLVKKLFGDWGTSGTDTQLSIYKNISLPVNSETGYRITSDYSSNEKFRMNRPHTGIDIGVPIGTDVYATQSGIVVSSGYSKGYGNRIELNNADQKMGTLYGHNSKLLVKQGDYVTKGQVIAKSGNTGHVEPSPTEEHPNWGAHIHYELRYNRRAVSPYKYSKYLR